MLPQQYCLRWKYHHSNLQTMFSHLLDRGCFCDVTLACEGQLIRAHRVVLCACSTFFDTVLTNYASERDPIIIIKDVTFADVKCLIEFMYKGEINVDHASLASLLKTADDLKIKGLAEVSWRDDETDPLMMADSRLQENIPQNEQRTPPRNYHDERVSSPLPLAANSRVPRMPMLTPMPPLHVGEYVGPKRKRGRPPLDDSYDAFSTPKITQVTPNCEIVYPEVLTQLNASPVEKQCQPHHEQDDPIQSCPEPQAWSQQNEDRESEEQRPEKNIPQEPISSAVPEYYQNKESHDSENDRDQEITIDEDRKYCIDSDMNDAGEDHEQSSSKLDEFETTETNLTTEELAQWGDVVKMDAYLAKGRRPQFWEEPFTRRVLDAIKNKKLEMKKAAKVLGVSYGTLYGRYREVYGCLKHPYRPNTSMMNRYDLVWPHKRSGNKNRKYKRKKMWSAAEEDTLIQIWTEYISDIRGKKKTNHVYQEMAMEMANRSFYFSPIEIKVKINNLTGKYKKEKAKIASSEGSQSEWPYYDKIHSILGSFKVPKFKVFADESISDNGSEISFHECPPQYSPVPLSPAPPDSPAHGSSITSTETSVTSFTTSKKAEKINIDTDPLGEFKTADECVKEETMSVIEKG